ARAALALIAAFFRPAEVEMLAQQIKERRARIEHEGMTRSIDGQASGNCLRRRKSSGRLCGDGVCPVIGHVKLLWIVLISTGNGYDPAARFQASCLERSP